MRTVLSKWLKQNTFWRHTDPADNNLVYKVSPPSFILPITLRCYFCEFVACLLKADGVYPCIDGVVEVQIRKQCVIRLKAPEQPLNGPCDAIVGRLLFQRSRFNFESQMFSPNNLMMKNVLLWSSTLWFRRPKPYHFTTVLVSLQVLWRPPRFPAGRN